MLSNTVIHAEPVCYVVARICGQHMEKDKALERRFQQVFIKQPNVEDTVSFPLAEVSNGLIEFCDTKIVPYLVLRPVASRFSSFAHTKTPTTPTFLRGGGHLFPHMRFSVEMYLPVTCRTIHDQDFAWGHGRLMSSTRPVTFASFLFPGTVLDTDIYKDSKSVVHAACARDRR